MKIIVGLGNPGTPYQQTRHNAGFLVVERLAATNHISLSTRRFKSLYGTGTLGSEDVILVKPLTFMNRSGEAVRKVIDHFAVKPEDLIVVHDDLDLPFGKLRIKRKGRDGGHQGVRSIIDSIGRETFPRLKIGIGRPSEGMDAVEYVLESFDEVERSALGEILFRAAESIVVLLAEGIEAAIIHCQRKFIRPSQAP